MNEQQRQFDALVRAYSGELFRYAFWLCHDDTLAQDLVQITFLRAWHTPAAPRAGAPAMTWLALSLHREQARRLQHQTRDGADLDAIELDDRGAPSPERASEDAMLRAALHQLAPQHRDPLLLQVLGGLDCAEIAQELQRPEGTVMTQLARARQRLKALLDRDPHDAAFEPLLLRALRIPPPPRLAERILLAAEAAERRQQRQQRQRRLALVWGAAAAVLAGLAAALRWL